VSATRSYVEGPLGQAHLCIAGPANGPVVLLLHQVPRSVDEFRDVVPLLAARGLRAVAVDLPGFGASAPAREDSIAAYADVVLSVVNLCTAAGGRFALVGHHTGGVVAVEVAARVPERVAALVLSSTPLVDAEHRARPAHGVDDVTAAAGGEHLVALWQGRQRFYPPGRPDLLERFVRDALTAGLVRSHAGHAAVRAYRMEDRLPALLPLRSRTLLLAALDDPFAAPHVPRLVAALGGVGVTELPGGVPLPDQLPEEFARVVADHCLPWAGPP